MTDQNRIKLHNLYLGLANLLEYPDARWYSFLDATWDHVSGAPSTLLKALTVFRVVADNESLANLQELYTRTFDLNPVCALEIGYHLFGENYKRGEFLANLRETEAPFSLGQQNQLPDYLPVLLRLLTKLEDVELRMSLVSECLIPAVEKMIKALANTENPYQHLLECVAALLRSEPGIKTSSTASHEQFVRARLEVLTGAAENPPARRSL